MFYRSNQQPAAADTTQQDQSAPLQTQPQPITLRNSSGWPISPSGDEVITIFSRDDMDHIRLGQTFTAPDGASYVLSGAAFVPHVPGLYACTFVRLEQP